MKISILTPVYNRQDCIKNCMESVRRQTGFDCEIEHVVVDDGSTDKTAEIIKEYAATHPHVKPVYFKENRGTNAGRNAAAKAAEGDYILLLDSDDEMMEGALQAIISTIKAHPEYSYFMFGCDYREDYNKKFERKCEFTLQDFLEGTADGDFIHAMKREIMTGHPFNEEIRIYEGVFFLRFYKAAGKILFTNRTLYHINRARTDHVTFTLNKTRDEVLRKDCIAYNLHYEWFGKEYANTQKGRQRILSILKKSFINHIFLGSYTEARTDLEHMREIDRHYKTPAIYRAIYRLRAGRAAWLFAKNMIKTKHFLKGGKL